MKKDNRWLLRQRNDQFVKQAKQANYRSRAVFKLQEIDRRDHLFKPGQTVVDLGSAPGSWSQYASERIQPDGRVIAVDILPMDAITGVEFIQGDFNRDEVFERCLAGLGGQADLVISDIAPNLTGIRDTDQARSMQLAELVVEFARKGLRPGGHLLIKLFEGTGTEQLRRDLNKRFQKVTVRKPDASRDSSREFYILALRNMI